MSQQPSEASRVADRTQALGQIRNAMIEKKLTQVELADAADCHEKTIQNLLAGRSVRDQTLFDVCMVLGLDFVRLKDAWHGAAATGGPMEVKGELKGEGGGIVAPVYMGAYSRAAVDHFIGSYLTVRPAFSKPGQIVAYRTDILWDPDWPSLLFEERERPDAPYAHRGRLYIPASSSYIHLVSLTKGAMRMVIVSQIDRAGEMRGLITTLNKQRASFVPVSAPIVYAKRDSFAANAFGDIEPSHAQFAAYKALLAETLGEGYARLASI